MGSTHELQLSLPGRPDSVGNIRRAVERWATECGAPAERVQDIKTAVSEAVTNAVVHAYAEMPGDVAVTARCRRGQIEVIVADRGSGMLPRRESEGLGLGLPLISTLTDRLEITASTEGGGGEAEGTEVHMLFEFEAVAASGDAAA